MSGVSEDREYGATPAGILLMAFFFFICFIFAAGSNPNGAGVALFFSMMLFACFIIMFAISFTIHLLRGGKAKITWDDTSAPAGDTAMPHRKVLGESVVLKEYDPGNAAEPDRLTVSHR